MPTETFDITTTGLDLETRIEQDVVGDLTKAGDFLPRVQICGSNTELVKEGKIPMGTHGLVYTKEKFEDLGKEISFMSITFRPKAMRMPSGANPISFFDRNSAEFLQIQKESTQANSGCMWGPEFLIWLPGQDVLATFFCSSQTMRRAAGALFTIMQREPGIFAPAPARSVIKFIKGAKFSWHGSDFFPQSTPLPPPPESFAEKLEIELGKFRNPPVSEVEVAAPVSDRAR